MKDLKEFAEKIEHNDFELVLTPEELLERAKSLAGKTREKESLEDAKSACTSNYTAKIRIIAEEITKLSNCITTGKESRTIECLIKYNCPEKGKKTYFDNADHSKILRVGAMLQHEIDDFLINPPEAAPKKTKKGRKEKDAANSNDTMVAKRDLRKVVAEACSQGDCCQCEKESCPDRSSSFGNAKGCKAAMACSKSCPRLEKITESCMGK